MYHFSLHIILTLMQLDIKEKIKNNLTLFLSYKTSI